MPFEAYPQIGNASLKYLLWTNGNLIQYKSKI